MRLANISHLLQSNFLHHESLFLSALFRLVHAFVVVVVILGSLVLVALFICLVNVNGLALLIRLGFFNIVCGAGLVTLSCFTLVFSTRDPR